MKGEPEIIIAANVSSNRPIGPIAVYLDGQKIDTEVMGRDVDHVAFFTGRILSPGLHKVRAVATAEGGSSVEADWSFTVLSVPTNTPARSK